MPLPLRLGRVLPLLPLWGAKNHTGPESRYFSETAPVGTRAGATVTCTCAAPLSRHGYASLLEVNAPDL